MSFKEFSSNADLEKNNPVEIKDEESVEEKRIDTIESEAMKKNEVGVSFSEQDNSFTLDVDNPEGSATFLKVKLPTFDEDQAKRMSEYMQNLLAEIKNNPERKKFIRGSELTGPSKIIADVAMREGDSEKQYKMKADQYLSKKMLEYKKTVESLNGVFGEDVDGDNEMTAKERTTKFLDKQAEMDILPDSAIVIQELGEKVGESEKTEVAKLLIEKGFQNSLLESIDRYGAVDKKEILQFLVEKGSFSLIARKFDKLDLEPNEAAQILIDNKNEHLIVENISSFFEIDKNLVEKLLSSDIPSELFFEDLLSSVDKFSKISKSEIAKVLIESGHASELLNFTNFEQFDIETLKLLVVEIESGRLDREFLETLQYVSDKSDEEVVKLLESVKA